MPQNPILKKHIYNIQPYLIFFTGSFLFFGFFADYIEFYQEKTSLFVFSHDYFIDNISQPGSLLLYLGRFLTTFYYHPLAGAIIISSVICLIIWFIARIIRFLSGKAATMLPLLFGTAFLIMHSDYRFLLFNSLGVLLQLILFYSAIKYMKGFIPVIIFPFWYYLTGGFAWVFALMYVLHLAVISARKKWPVIVSLFVLGLLTVYVLKQFFIFRPFGDLIIYPFTFEDTGTQYKLLLPVTGLLILLPLVSLINFRLSVWTKQKDSGKQIFFSILYMILVITTAFLSFDKVLKEYFHVEKLFYQNRFEEITRYISNHPTTNRLTIFLNNIALSETEKLNGMLFHFPQSPDGESLFLKWEMYGEVLRRGGYFYYSTGMINEAHRWAYENMIMTGLTPEGMKTLIKTELINGNYKVAAKYVSVLKRTLFYRNEAKEFEKLLFDDKIVESHPELGPKRREKIEHDFFSITDNPYINIEKVLLKDSLNRRVFEYKMAYMMLTEEYDSIGSGLVKLRNFGYAKIPLHLEEAALVYKLSTSGPLPDMGGLTINPQTEVRFNQFLQTFQTYGNNLKTAQPFLKQKFGNTFWFYAFYH